MFLDFWRYRDSEKSSRQPRSSVELPSFKLYILPVATKAKAYNTCRAPQAATATSEALVMSQAKLA